MERTVQTIERLRRLRLSRWVAATAVPPVALPPMGTVVVVAPHPDDETFGAGGTIHDLARIGFAVSIVVVSDGAASHDDIADLADVRNREARRAAEALGVCDSIQFLDLPDGHVGEHREALAARLRSLIDNCVLVVAPRSGDGHCDHEATAEAVIEAIMGVPEDRRPALWRYAIWAWEWDGICATDLDGAAMWKISDAGRTQRSMAIASYRSQIIADFDESGGQPIVPAAMIADIESADEVFWC